MPHRPQIIFDVITKSVVIMYDGKLVTLAGPFRSRTTAMSAAMDECAKRGWLDTAVR